MSRSLHLFSSVMLSAFLAVGVSSLSHCGGKTNNNSDGGGDMGEAQEANLCSGNGCIGAPCTSASECTEGTGGPAVCWTTTLLNMPKLVATPGGYCSRECSADSDCGSAKCVSLPGSGKKFCMAKCASATRCRKPGYSCAYDGEAGGICFPNANFDCNPTTSDGVCEYGANKYLGGCIRVAYESDHGGICHSQCYVGKSTCPADDRAGNPAPAQQCIYVDTSLDSGGNPSPVGDKFKGNVCFQQSSTPVADGQACKYWTDCVDGYQCDRYNVTESSRVCRQLCLQGTMGPPVPQPSILTPNGGIPVGNACSNSLQGCANSLRAGLAEGSTGLCQPKM